MTTLVLVVALAIYLIFYFSFGKGLQTKLLKSQEAPAAPSQRLSDGVDYIPTSKYVLFGHHFASIAGAGPIVGPAIAIAWGWLPGLLWIWFGNIFIGAIHDYLALTASVRYDGRSVQFVAQELIGKKAGKSFGWFILFLCFLVVAAFGDIVAGQFAGDGAVASTFFLFCASAIVLGILMYRTKLPMIISTLIGIVLLIASFVIGKHVGISASKDVWFLVIFIYIIIASSLPVNILLQPRDYLNSFLLYFGLITGAIGAILSAKGFDSVPVFTSFSAKVIGGKPSPFWPTVPLVIACGALSGFHALIASGTSSKQLRDEKDGLFVGYGAMLTEGFLATISVIAIAAFGVQALGEGKVLATPPLARFTASYGAMVASAMPFFTAKFMKLFAAIWVSSFALTTLDTTNRLGRYIVSELSLPAKEKRPGLYKFFNNKWVGSLVVAFFGIGLAWSGNYTILWPAFSGANQLIASIVMLTVAMWVKKELNEKYTNLVFIPAVFLWITVTAAIIWYQIAIVPAHFADPGNIKNLITGTLVGLMNIIMIIINIAMVVTFFKNFGKDKAVKA
jgi:carbon starvation protein